MFWHGRAPHFARLAPELAIADGALGFWQAISGGYFGH
jgi:hypothetical protein